MTEEQMEPTIQYQFLTGETWINWKKAYEEAVERHYGTLDIEIAVIGINVKGNEK